MSALAVLLASLTLLGWLLDVPVLTSLLPGRVSTKPNSAIALLAASLSLWSISTATSLILRRVATALAVVPGLIGGLTLAEYALGMDFAIDPLLLQKASGALGTSSPGRMAHNAAVACIALSIALVSLSDPRKTCGSALRLAGLAFFISMLALTGYLYGVEPLYGVALYTQMAQARLLHQDGKPTPTPESPGKGTDGPADLPPWAQRLWKLTGVDVNPCPKCKAGRLERHPLPEGRAPP